VAHATGLSGIQADRDRRASQLIVATQRAIADPNTRRGTDILGMRDLPTPEINTKEDEYNRRVLADAQRRLKAASAEIDQQQKDKQQGGGIVSTNPENPGFVGHVTSGMLGQVQPAFSNMNGMGLTGPAMAAGRLGYGAFRGAARWATAPEAQPVVGLGAAVDKSAMIQGFRDVEAAQKKIAEGAEKEYQILVQRGNQLQQQIATGNQLLDQAKEQVKAQQDQVNSSKADLAALPRELQHTIAGILHDLNAGKDVSQAKLMLLKQYHVTQGTIGAKLNAKMAKEIDPELATEWTGYGGAEDLNVVLKKRTEIEDALNKATAELAITMVREKLKLEQHQTATVASEQAGRSAVRLQGEKDNVTVDETGAAAPLKKGTEHVGGAIDTLLFEFKAYSKATFDKITDLATEVRRSAQLIKGAQK